MVVCDVCGDRPAHPAFEVCVRCLTAGAMFALQWVTDLHARGSTDEEIDAIVTSAPASTPRPSGGLRAVA